MTRNLQKNDFVEIEYIGKVKDGDIFDTNIEEEAKKIGVDIKTRPLIICIGQGMILPAIDEFLIGKEDGNSYTLKLPPEKAFGARKRELVKTMPLSVFNKHQITPQTGMVFTFDNLLGRISAVSGGRVIVDFNNPLAGKDVVYNLKIKRKLTDINEKIKTLMLTFFRKEFEYELKNKKLILKAELGFKKFIELFKKKFKEILDLELEVQKTEKK